MFDVLSALDESFAVLCEEDGVVNPIKYNSRTIESLILLEEPVNPKKLVELSPPCLKSSMDFSFLDPMEVTISANTRPHESSPGSSGIARESEHMLPSPMEDKEYGDGDDDDVV
ncbi:hypothetical protein L1887_28907 [Cichorium endivia]|nr:hypothetical protein L1887_28907 [Cichorium endivia]